MIPLWKSPIKLPVEQLLEVAMANADVDVYGLTEAVMICKAEDSASAPD